MNSWETQTSEGEGKVNQRQEGGVVRWEINCHLQTVHQRIYDPLR